MKRPPDDDADALRILDTYLSLQADRVFENAAPLGDWRLGLSQLGSQGSRRRATLTGLIAVLAVAFATLGGTRTDPISVSSLRGELSHLLGTSVWRTDTVLELEWNPVAESSHYSVRAWDFHGVLVASEILGGDRTTANIEVLTDSARPVTWAVVAWDDTGRLVASEVMMVALGR